VLPSERRVPGVQTIPLPKAFVFKEKLKVSFGKKLPKVKKKLPKAEKKLPKVGKKLPRVGNR